MEQPTKNDYSQSVLIDIPTLANETNNNPILSIDLKSVDEPLNLFFDRPTLESTITNPIVLQAYDDMARKCPKLFSVPDNARLIERAFIVAYTKHDGQSRKTGEPYILHPIAVARIVAEEIKLEDAVSIAAALLHDVVEDTGTSLEEIERDFGKVVAKIVDGLTKIKRVSKKQTEKETQNSQVPISEKTLQENKQAFVEKAENLKRVLLTLAEDVRVIIVKIADRVHNMRTMDSMLPHKRLEIASETVYIYSPTAHRLGLYRIKSELEDLCMKYLNAEVYKELALKLQATKTERETYINNFIEPLKKRLKAEIPDLPDFRIFGRPKHIYSIHNKIKNKGVSFEEIFDLFAIRIVINSTPNTEKADCWKVYSKITDIYTTTGDRLRDWVTNPRANGYRSLHTTVMNTDGRPVEIQIRSEDMDAVAERGVAAHWVYKNGTSKDKFDSFIDNIRTVFQNRDTNVVEALNDIRREFYDNEIYVFTPKGEIRTLRAGATVLDLAFDIHTDLGCSCIGGEIDGKLYRINHVLTNGQQVKLIISKKQKPSEEWLNWAVTTKARAKIKSVLKGYALKEANDGRELLDRKLKQWKLPVSDAFIQNLAAHFRYKDRRLFLAAIGTQKFDIQQIKKLTVEGEKIISQRGSKPIAKTGNENIEKVGKTLNEENGLTLTGGLDKVSYTLAKCCKPVAGDPVFGFITITQGITIHRLTCPNAESMRTRFPYRVININWNDQAQDEPFLTTLRLSGIDDVGLVNRITSIISSELNINMRAISLNASDGIFEGKLQVYVKNTQELDNLVKRLKQIESIHTIKRGVNEVR
jgi:guanosine-3',5'-bis(diphosphate) 3'-pyrophosphohydrolase